MKNIILKFFMGALLGLVLPYTACSVGGNGGNAQIPEQHMETEQDAPDCPDGDCSKEGEDNGCPDCPEKGKEPRFKAPRHGGRRKRRGRVITPVPEPIEGQPQ